MLVSYRRVPLTPSPKRSSDLDGNESEMPEVVLDCNRHIIPKWMLGGRVQSESVLADAENLDVLASESQQDPSLSRRRRRSRSLGTPKKHLEIPSLLPETEKIRPMAPKVDPLVTRQNHFILMEDLTGRLKHSCVMDLKMGTRQYGIDATSVKKKSQRKKCDQTTSRSLGVRVCGMQVSKKIFSPTPNMCLFGCFTVYMMFT
jgi:hypothetical protein